MFLSEIIQVDLISLLWKSLDIETDKGKLNESYTCLFLDTVRSYVYLKIKLLITFTLYKTCTNFNVLQ